MLLQGRRHVTVGLAALALGLAPPMAAPPANAADPIKVGWVGPLSPPGGYAEGALMKQAAELAADEINAKGGVLGRPIQVVFQDTRGQPEEGTAAAERLISQEKVVAITGEFHSSVFLAEMEVAHNAGIPIIAVDVWALKITGKGYPEVFR
ncbi:MAG: ABC transporter substrate-binding protein, partial [Alphaproteobacteria bacterium]|nr:ABC transporter substrate-binding protein [Alphaproteobacteria bacterium]